MLRTLASTLITSSSSNNRSTHRVVRMQSFGPRIAVAFWCACSVQSFSSVLPTYVSAARAGSLSSTTTSTSTRDLTTITTTTTTTTTSMTPSEKLAALREHMKEKDLDVWIVPTDDPHLSEYVPEAYKRREFLTGFKGSAGTAVVTADDAFLWTDSRYWNEASLQLDASLWKLKKAGLPSTPTIPKWLAQESKKKPLKIGIDPFVHPASFSKEVKTALEEEEEEIMNDEQAGSASEIKTLHTNLVDEIWNDRPPVPMSPWRVHPLEFAGITWQTKVAKVRAAMKEKKATMAVFSTLDDVAYLFNLRCQGDIDTCPVGIAYATVTMDTVTLFVHEDKMKASPEDVHKHLEGVSIQSYDTIVDAVKGHVETTGKAKVWLDASRANYALTLVIPEKSLLDAQNAITPMKGVKNRAELEGMREAHIVDGVAMAKFIAWLQETLKERPVSEVEIDKVLTGYRAEQRGFNEVSFPTIAGVGPNAAIIHYRATEGSDILKYLDTTQPILIDSGGQYSYGTTDVTRTWHFGTPTKEFVDAYTRVLKGNIGMDQMIFPENVPGFVLDVYARQALWQVGKDYGHGTGHGVGAALNVHEGPHSISPRFANKEGLKKGMIVSNEPGYYEDGNFGVRIENLLELRYVKPELNEEVEKEQLKEPSLDDEQSTEDASSDEKNFLQFEALTLIPIQKNLIDISLMTEAELDWLDSYHAKVWEKVSPRLEEGTPEYLWLKESCEKIDRKLQ